MGSVVLAGATSGSTTITPTDAVTATLTLPSTTGTLGLASGSATQSINAQNTFGFKNRIINGGMTIDQRNAGATVSAVANNVYLLDRYRLTGSATVSGKFNFAQNLNSVTPPVGFSYYSGFQTATAYTVSGTDLAVYEQIIEGYNVADMAFGTASAKTFTISFWVYSSLTGTFGGCLKNIGYSYSYPFTYSIPTANTWTFITINVTAPTGNSWNSTNSVGLRVMFGLGVGTGASGTANNTWQSADYYSATGAVSVIGTTSATWYVTGFQVEVGTQATSFDFRDYGREYNMCLRYHNNFGGTDASPGQFNDFPAWMYTSTVVMSGNILPVPMRATPTVTVVAATVYYNGGGLTQSGAPTGTGISNQLIRYRVGLTNGTGGGAATMYAQLYCDAEL